MVARRHQMRVKRLPLRRILIEYAQRVVEQILITSAPDGAARYLFRPHRRLINDLVAVSAEEGPHIVEIAVAAVEKLRAVALLAQDRAHRVQARVVGLLDLALAGTRRLTQGDGLQSAHRTVAAGVEAFEEQTMLRQTIQARRQIILIAKGRHIVGAQALHHYQHDILARFRQRIFDFSRIQALHHILRLLRRHGKVELVVIELAGAKCLHKFAESVVAQFVDILVTTQAQRRESYRAEQGYDAGRQIKARRPQFYAERSLRYNDFSLLQDHERRNQQRCNAQTDQQRHHRVRFKDVSDDLIRVNQVVDGYKIIAYAKFSPKEISRNGIDEQGRDKDEHGQEKDHLTIHRPNAGKGPTKAETHSLIEGQVSQNARQTLIKFRQTFIEERQI